MKTFIIPAISFLLGAIVMFVAVPGERLPEAVLQLSTDRGVIAIPLSKDIATRFVNVGTNMLQIYGINVQKIGGPVSAK